MRFINAIVTSKGSKSRCVQTSITQYKTTNIGCRWHESRQ